MVISTIGVFAGTGMLDEGVRAGLEYLGIGHRPVLYIEREAHAAAVLVARMEEGSLDAAPIWSDLLTFDSSVVRGKVDCVVAGFPCQDISVAGRRAGLDGKRSGLFFDTLDLAESSGAWLLFLENVAGISSATATVVDEAEGELDERAAARVVGELADRGWNAEWIVISASDVGASHGRARWFCIAWRMDDSERAERRTPCSGGASSKQRNDGGRTKTHGRPGVAEQILDDAARHVGSRPHGQSGGGWRVCEASHELANTQGDVRRRELQSGESTKHGRTGSAGSSLELATGEYGAVTEFVGLFAPGPSDPRWQDILDEFPEVAPAVESTFRCVVNGLDFDMGDSRAARLKCVGNGVVALDAAVAFVVLARRAGLFQP